MGDYILEVKRTKKCCCLKTANQILSTAFLSKIVWQTCYKCMYLLLNLECWMLTAFGYGKWLFYFHCLCNLKERIFLSLPTLQSCIYYNSYTVSLIIDKIENYGNKLSLGALHSPILALVREYYKKEEN